MSFPFKKRNLKKGPDKTTNNTNKKVEVKNDAHVNYVLWDDERGGRRLEEKKRDASSETTSSSSSRVVVVVVFFVARKKDKETRVSPRELIGN